MSPTLLSKLSKKIKTPFYVYDLDQIKKQALALKKTFQGAGHFHYAMKANSNLGILKLFKRLGLGVDVVSGGEIKIALKAGFKGPQMIFSGVGKTEEEINFALKNKVHMINVESIPEMLRIDRLAKKKKCVASIALRLNPDVDAETHPHITTGTYTNKFGIDFEDLDEAKKVLKSAQNLRLIGLTFHIGSQILNLSPLEKAFQRIIPIYQDLKNLGFPLENLSVGGGIGIRYNQETPMSLESYGDLVLKYLKPLRCNILCEPGRILVAESGVLVTEVQYVKRTRKKNFLIVDTGMNHLMRPALYGAFHEMKAVESFKDRKTETYDVVGPICESTDVLGVDRTMPEMKEGEKLLILNTGAYGYSMANNYNAQPMPKEILVSGARVFRR